MAKVKICGITSAEDAVNVQRLKPDALGFVFYRKSPRFITPSKAASIISKIPRSIKKVGVFVNPGANYIRRVAALLKLDMLQLHGDEPPSFCDKLKGYKVIKCIRVKDENSLKGLSRYRAWGFMFDTYKKDLFGGTGSRFDWRLIKTAAKKHKNVFLSGGLNARNVKAAIKCVRPDWVDVSSSVEKAPGKKDYKKVREFILGVRGIKKQLASSAL